MSKSKAKGTKWETAIVDYLNEYGLAAARLPMMGANDRGDITIDDVPVTIEAKNCKAMALAGWVDEATVEARRRHWHEIGVVWHHRVGKASPGEGYVTMSGEMFARMLRLVELGWPLDRHDDRVHP